MKPKKPAPTYPKAIKARVLADAAQRGDPAARAAHGVNAATLRGWRHELATDPELDRLYAAHLRRIADTWLPAVSATLQKALTVLGTRIDAGQVDDFVLVGVVRTLGEVMVTQGALAPETDPDAGHAGEGGIGPAEAGPAAPATKH